ncbi:MAG TPA: hypothetical protein VE262_01705 [Blastocatellia bacterium]|nr:hypothetical protein [Blastocatellia bacterium]
MSNRLKQIYNACDPYEPASSEHYCSCAEARGESVLAQEFLRRLRLTDQHISFLFSGHIGCGKSSELEQLRRVLTKNIPYHPRYFPILIDVSDYLDD